MTIAFDNAAPIARFGHTWRPWTKRQLIELSARLPLTKAERALVSYSDMLRYISSIDGMDAALAVAGCMPESQVATLASIEQKSRLLGDLTDIMLGAYASKEEPEEPQRPLAETTGTGA